MNKLVLFLIVALLIVASFFAGYYLTKPTTPSDAIPKSQETILNESQCQEACAKKGDDYYGACAYDDLKLNDEKMGSCAVASGACSAKSCSCYCQLPQPTS